MLDAHLQSIFNRAMESAQRASEVRRADPVPESKMEVKQIWQLCVRRLQSAKYRLTILYIMVDGSGTYREGELDHEQTIRYFEKNGWPLDALPRNDNQVVYIIENGKLTRFGKKGLMDDLG